MDLGVRTPESEGAKGIKRLVIKELRVTNSSLDKKRERREKNDNSAGRSEGYTVMVSRHPRKGTPI